jgi:hypothetical protein
MVKPCVLRFEFWPGGMEHHDFMSKFINSEMPITLELATLLCISPFARTYHT